MSNSKGRRAFLDICLSAENEKILSELLELFLTPEENSSLETRCLIIQSLLAQKKSQRQISHDLNVSIAKITRGSNGLKLISPRLKKYLEDKLLD